MALAPFAESTQVTQWPMRLLLVAVVLGVIAAVLVGMRRGWRNRALRQSGIAELPVAPEAFEPLTLEPVHGVYLGSTAAGDWLDRIVVHGLGVRSRAALEAGPQGVLLRRSGAPDVFIPSECLREARADRGIAGKAYERDGVLVVTWDLDGRLIDTGFRADEAAQQAAAEAAVRALAGEGRMQ